MLKMWQMFVDNTTLHGIRYVFMKRHILVRLIWLVLLLASGGYYIFTVYRAITKYVHRPINTVVSIKHLKHMDFPAVTICPLNDFAESKLYMTDDNPLFASSGLNISSCAVTSAVRSNRPCGWSILCALPDFENLTSAIPNCTRQYRQDLLDAMQRSLHHIDKVSFYRHYSQDINALIGPLCNFQLFPSCSAKDFVPLVTQFGVCYTFNSGTDGKIKTVESGGVSFGLSVILDVQTYEYSYGKFSEGFKVLIHGQGEYINEWEGTNVGPGQHVVMALTQKKFKNLEKPYATNCTMNTLQTFSTYTIEGCLYECEAKKVIKVCGCRLSGYKDGLQISECISKEDFICQSRTSATLDVESCQCEVPCSETKYSSEVSYSKFPDPGTAKKLLLSGYSRDIQYQRDNLVFLQVGFKSLSYEMQEQKPAYDSNSLFGEIGGSMGLFLGCSLLTICEFFDFLVRFLATRRRQVSFPAPHETSHNEETVLKGQNLTNEKHPSILP